MCIFSLENGLNILENIVVISCWFGEKFNKPTKVKSWFDLKVKLKVAIKSHLPRRVSTFFNIQSVIPNRPDDLSRCFFFTNNQSLKKEILAKGWEYIYIEKSITNGESIDSSLQAKQVKFLQLGADILAVLLTYKYIVYMDSRRITDNITELTERCEHGVLIRLTPREKNSIWDEVNEAKSQERYARNMDKTIQFLNNKLQGDYTDKHRVMNTGILVYKVDVLETRLMILKLCHEVYSACIALDQPECQIFWCLFSQNYNDIITKVEFDTIDTRSGL